MARTALPATLACALTLGFSAAAVAQPHRHHHHHRHQDTPPAPDVSPEQQNEARNHLRAGAQHYQDGDYAQAITEFRRAHELYPTPRILFNLAQAYRRGGMLSEAITTFRRYVAESPDLASEQRREVEDAIAEIEANRAVLTFEVEPAGATVTLDGRDLGTAPLARNAEVLPGEHRVSIRLENYVSHEERVEVSAHDQRLVNVTLRPTERNARLVVNATPAEAHISIDGLEAGTGSVTQQVAPGDFTVSVTADGYTAQTRRVHVNRLSTESLSVTLDRPRPSVFTRPWFWATVGGVVVVGTLLAIILNPIDPDPVPGNGTPPVVQSILTF
jgi:hypothetical protein